ncbi:MAG: bacterio-opsin activator domain-containing protein [Halolamina sp.]
MTEAATSVLVIDPAQGEGRSAEALLREAEHQSAQGADDVAPTGRFRVHRKRSLEAATDRIERTAIDVVLLDLTGFESTATEPLHQIIDVASVGPVIVLIESADERARTEAITHGARETLVKDELSSEVLARSIARAVAHDQQPREPGRREGQLARLDGLSRELRDLETPDAVCDRVIRTVTSRPTPPAVAIALYDDEAGALEPAATADADDLLDLGDLLEKRGAAWRAFTRGGAPFRQSVETASSELTETALFPMAPHGVVVAGTTAVDGIASADFEFVGAVVGILRAALDRIERDRDAATRECRLQAQERTIDRLDQTSTLFRGVTRALVRAKSRTEIESAVCDRLVERGLIDLAWIGEHDRASERVTVRAQASGQSRSAAVPAAEIHELAGPGSPVERAAADGSRRVVDDVLGDATAEGWQRAALDRGFHAIASFPLRYEGANYGTLNVYTEQSGGFDDLEKSVLEELATTVAYAITAAERKRALTDPEVIRLEFDVAETGMAFVELARELECSLRAENFVTQAAGGVRRFLAVRGASAAAALDAAAELPFTEFALVSEYEVAGEETRLFRTALADGGPESTMLEHGARPCELRAEDGEATVTAELGADAPVREFVDLFRDRFPGAELLAQRTHNRTETAVAQQRASVAAALTDRQREAIRTAYRSGFFDRPRTQTGTEIADAMGISQPTFSHHLREAQRRLCAVLFGEGRPGDRA